jgi:hypothetical protein
VPPVTATAAVPDAGAAVPDLGAAASTPMLADDFEDGNASGWSTSGGQWSVGSDGSQAYRQRSGSASASARTGDPTWTDYTVSVRVRPTAFRPGRSTIGVLARLQSSTSYYYLTLRADNQLELGKLVSGRVTPLATAPATVTLGAWHTLRLAVLGNSLVGQFGTVSVSATDGQFNAGRIGLVTTSAAGSFDDVLMEPPAPAPDRQAPSTPGQPQVLEVVPGAVTITWPASTDNVGVAQYYVYQGDQFYTQWIARIVPDNSPLTLPLGATAAISHFSVSARDAAGNTSTISSRVTVPQPPSFPRSGDNTVPPTAPGRPTVLGVTADGYLLGWEPATDDLGVVEYHVHHVFAVDELRVAAKVTTNTAVIVPRGGYETVRIVAYDASWNSSSSVTVQLTPPPTPSALPPTPPTG